MRNLQAGSSGQRRAERAKSRAKSDNELDGGRSKRSGVRMIATRAGSKAKALLPSGWFQRGEMRLGAGIPVGILGDAANAESAVSIEATLRLRSGVKGTQPV
jgi:hypothetical protein